MPTVTLPSVLHEAEEKMKKALASMEREFATVRGGRASPMMIEGVMVEYYGTPTPLKQLATITTPEPRLLLIQPWDRSVIGAIDKAILQAGLGVTPQQDGKVVRLPIPQLTQERRAELDKLIRKMAEDGRVSVRTVRRDANEALKQLKVEKTISEDDAFKAQERIQHMTDDSIHRVDALLKAKEQELQVV